MTRGASGGLYDVVMGSTGRDLSAIVARRVLCKVCLREQSQLPPGGRRSAILRFAAGRPADNEAPPAAVITREGPDTARVGSWAGPSREIRRGADRLSII